LLAAPTSTLPLSMIEFIVARLYVKEEEIVNSSLIKNKHIRHRKGTVIDTKMLVMAIWKVCSLQENLKHKWCVTYCV